MFRVCFEIDAFRDDASPQELNAYVTSLAWALYMIDCEYLIRYPNTPGIYQSGVYYEAEKSRAQTELWWRDIPRILSVGYADCKGLSAWRAAELTIRHNIDAEPVVSYTTAPGEILFHVQVQTPNGIEDPSERLGMGRENYRSNQWVF